MSLKRRIAVAGLLALAVLLLSPLLALARGGGGGHFGGGGGSFGGGGFHGGGSFGGSSGYYGGGGGGLGFLLPLFFFGGGGGGFIFFLFILLAVYQLWRRTSLRTPVAATGWGPDYAPMTNLSASTVSTGLTALQSKDPNFNQQVFLDRVQAAFFALQQAWMDRNLEPARVYMSDGIYQRWKNQIDQMVAEHKRNILENLVIGGTEIAKVDSDASFDSITVRIDASAADYEVDDRDPSKVVFGSRQSQPFTEYWSFIRSAAARTRAGEGAQITQCPNCGAPLSINESGVCNWCKAIVTSGQFGWVLDNITQASEWQG